MTFQERIKLIIDYSSPPRNGNKKSLSITPDGFIDYEGPISRSLHGNAFNSVKTGLSRDGVLFDRDELVDFTVRFAWACNTECALMNLTEELKKQYAAAEELWGNYKDKLKAFRSEVKNDVVSLEASARKTTEAVQKMNKAYGDVIMQMNGSEMKLAIENAERLAAAMTALSKLQSHRLVLAVTDQTKDTV